MKGTSYEICDRAMQAKKNNLMNQIQILQQRIQNLMDQQDQESHNEEVETLQNIISGLNDSIKSLTKKKKTSSMAG